MIAGEIAALAERAVTRHHERQRILADRGTHGARGLRRLDFRGDIGIGFFQRRDFPGTARCMSLAEVDNKYLSL